MAETTKIEWCDSTFNPVIGCTRLSPACDFCYAADLMDTRYGKVKWGEERVRTSKSNWQQPRRWQRQAESFFAEHGRRRRVFCASLSDVFDNQWEREWRDDLWELIREAPDLDWLLLTKRPMNIDKMLPDFWDEVKGHVWLGTTVEDQKRADQNLQHLLKHDSAVRFVSCEPLLGPIDLTRVAMEPVGTERRQYVAELTPNMHTQREKGEADFTLTFNAFGGVVERHLGFNALNWVITGGESGRYARPSDPEWYRFLRNQCAVESVPLLHKQNGEWISYEQIGTGWSFTREAGGQRFGVITRGDFGSSVELFDGRDFPTEYPWNTAERTGPCMVRIGKKHAGRLLDGVEHNGFPEVGHV